MGVDQSGEQNHLAEITLGSGKLRRQIRMAPDPGDALAFQADHAVLNGRPGDWNNNAGAQIHGEKNGSSPALGKRGVPRMR